MRGRIERVDGQIPAEFDTMIDKVAGAVAPRRFSTLVIGIFATVALGLATVGIYGVVSYAVARRTREMGIRLALGAAPGRVRKMVIREALTTVGIGVAAGVAGALALTRIMATMLFEVSATDPLTFTAVIFIIGTTALLAAYLPARRASDIDPTITMRDG